MIGNFLIMTIERERKKRRKGDRDRFSPSEMDYTKQSEEKIG